MRWGTSQITGCARFCLPALTSLSEMGFNLLITNRAGERFLFFLSTLLPALVALTVF